MEDLIPILIVIVISIIGSLRKKKRRAPLETKEPEFERKAQKDDIFSWLENLADPEDDPYEGTAVTEPIAVSETEEPLEEPLVEETPDPHKNKYKQYSGFISQEEKQKLAQVGQQNILDRVQIIKSRPMEITEISGKSRNRIMKDFDLKKAVVFSEILKRKY